MNEESLSKRIDAAMAECATILDCAPSWVDNRMIKMYKQLKQCAEVFEKHNLQGPTQ